MKDVKYIKIGSRQYKQKNVILFIVGIILIYVVLQVYIILNQDKLYKITPTSKEELIYLIKEQHIPLFMINTSEITDMSWLFHGGVFVNYTGIEFWDVSNVENMEGMFYGAGRIDADLNLWDISKVKNMRYMFAYSDYISKMQVNNWKVSDDVKYYGMFRGTELEKNPPEWFRLKNEFEIKYYPESKEELIRMLNDENILAGEIDVSKIDNVTEALDNIKRYNKSYLQEYHRLLSIKKGIDMEISKERFVGNSYSISSNQYIQSLEDISSEYHDKLIDISMQPFYEKLENPKKLIHDDYPGIEFWNVPNLYELLNKIYE